MKIEPSGPSRGAARRLAPAVLLALVLGACGGSCDDSDDGEPPRSNERSTTPPRTDRSSAVSDTSAATGAIDNTTAGTSNEETTAECEEVLERGCTGADVVRLQRLLRDSGVADIADDGEFGPGTEDALGRFEASCGECVEDGMIEIDGAEWRALESSIDQGNNSQGNAGELPPVDEALNVWFGGGDVFPCDDREGDYPSPYFGASRQDVWSIGRVMVLCAFGFGPEPIDVVVTGPDGSSAFTAFPASDRDNDLAADPLQGDELHYDATDGDQVFYFEFARFNFLLRTGTTRGEYTFEAQQGDIATSSTIQFLPGSNPGDACTQQERCAWLFPYIELLHLDTADDENAIYALSGLEPNELVPLAVYHLVDGPAADPDACPDCGRMDLYQPLEPVRVDADGAAVVAVSIDGYPSNRYCVTSPLVGAYVCDNEYPAWFEF